MRRDAAGRLTAELDRRGSAVAELDWQADGRLARASVRIPDGSWVTVLPAAAAPGPWGASDALLHGSRPVTRFGALDWSRITHIPPLAEPARLPSGAGTAVLNLIARLAADQGAGALGPIEQRGDLAFGDADREHAAHAHLMSSLAPLRGAG